MLVAIKKCEFFTRKTNFIRFIIKLEKISIVTALVENGRLWQWIVADNRRQFQDNRRQFQTILDSITVLANCRRLRSRNAKIT